MDWTPTISDRNGPLYERIVAALADDITDGRLRRGQQLPTHRTLAKALAVDLSTVTRAYREARQRGLIDARVGQGTFVAESMAQLRHADAPRAAFDLSMNLPPQPLDADLEGRISRGMAAISKEEGLSHYLNYREPRGLPEERDTAADWLRGRLPQAAGDRVVICPGTQCALTLTLHTVTKPGDVVLTEALTYPGAKAAAAYAGVQLTGVATDEAGIVPDALRAAIRRHKPKALYLVPTIQNPTTVTMPPKRRDAIAEILREADVPLIEDDAYGLLEPDVTPLAVRLADNTYYMASLSKCIAPGLRMSFLLAPDRAAAAVLSDALRAVAQMSAPLMIALVTRWLCDGSADAIIAAIREEAMARQKLAATVLGGFTYAARPAGHHIWLPLPRNWTSNALVAHVQRQGLAVVSSDAFAVGGEAPNAIRIALGAAASRNELASALGVLVTALRSPQHAAIV
ncbi:MAG TPA: PLP-dependent aminotransferase family protein [Rhizomicrobium sp.]|jgi:DNA-binding transcriptional MocR family regulator